MISLYTLHSTAAEGEFIIQKFDTDYRCESVYAMTSTECQCPQSHKPTCRHRKMFPLFLKFGHIGDGWFLEWDTRQWRKPVNDIPVDVPEEMVSRPSVGGEGDANPSSLPGADQPSPEAPPPSPPEGPQPPQAAEAAPARPVGVGAPIVKRRKIS
jgi:hypothetical protein